MTRRIYGPMTYTEAYCSAPAYGPITAAELYRRAVMCARRDFELADKKQPIIHHINARWMSIYMGVTEGSLMEAMGRASIDLHQIKSGAYGFPRSRVVTYSGRQMYEAAPALDESDSLAQDLGRILRMSNVSRDPQGRSLQERIADGTVVVAHVEERTRKIPSLDMSQPTRRGKSRGSHAAQLVASCDMFETAEDAEAREAMARLEEEDRADRARASQVETLLEEPGKASRDAALERAETMTPTQPRKGRRSELATPSKSVPTLAPAPPWPTLAPIPTPPPLTQALKTITMEEHLEALNFIALDVETSGSKKTDRVIELGMYAYKDGKAVGSWCWRFNIGDHPVNKWALKIHGIKSSDLVDCPKFDDVAVFIHRLITRAGVVVAHNLAGTDRRFLTYEFERVGLLWPHVLEVCTLRQSRTLHPATNEMKRKYTLDVMCRQYKIKLNNHHAALADARACGDLWVAMCRRERNAARQDRTPTDAYDIIAGEWRNQ